MKNEGMRKIASNSVSLDGIKLGRYVVEIMDGCVMAYYPLICELPFTEWTLEPIDMYTDSAGCVHVDSSNI